MNSIMDNPLLELSGVPDFEAILPEHAEPAVDWVIERNRAEIQSLTDSVEMPDWNNFMAPLEQINDELERVWAPVSHLNAVRNHEELRSVHEKCLRKLTDYSTEMGQNRDIYRAVRFLRDQDGYDRLDRARQMVIDHSLRDFHLSGIDLSPENQKRCREITSELSRLGNLFSQNLLDATDAWHMDVTDEDRLCGIPATAVDTARQTAESADVDGWRFTLHIPSYLAIMKYAEDAGLRAEMYHAYVTRASETGPNAGKWDNSEVMTDILALRREKAILLGYGNYAEYSLATKMAENTEEVLSFLLELSGRCRQTALREVEELKEYAREVLGTEELHPWDYRWASEKLRQQQFGFSAEALRAYFPLLKVLDGMFRITGILFDMEVEPAEPRSVWHPDVQFFRIRDRKGDTRGFFYLDLYARLQKQGGAWMADCVGRRMTENGVQLPVAFLTCNFSAPSGEGPSLLTHDEVITLFHEFGHGLHHMLTQVDVAGVAGINGVPWDAVELPSQLMENWCWEPEALRLISGHVDTGEPLPVEQLDRMRRGRNFQSGMQMCRQLVFSIFDFRLHAEFDPLGKESILDVLDTVREEISVVPESPFVRFPHSFSHIFGGGYAAGYYSYLWSEVLSADVFSMFEENGILDRKTGLRLLHRILEKGGSEEPMKLFQEFRGRKPTVDALLRHHGLAIVGHAESGG